MTIFFYKGLTRNPEIGNTLSEFCPISEDWGKLGIPNLAQMALAAKCQVYRFYRGDYPPPRLELATVLKKDFGVGTFL